MIHRKPIRIHLPMPPIGSKCYLLESPGLYVLEEGPGVLRTMPITHAGSGSLVIYDGFPDKDGNFPGRASEDDAAFNGREIFRQVPVVMGSWMMDGGFIHGLTAFLDCGAHSIRPVASIVWMPYRQRQAAPAA